MAVEAVWGWAKIWVLASTPGRVLSPHTWGRKPLIGMVMWRRTRHVWQTEEDAVKIREIKYNYTEVKLIIGRFAPPG